MLNEFRKYRLKPGALPTYVDAFHRLALPLINKHMSMLAFWTSDVGELNYVFHLWAFENAEKRAQQFAALRAEPEFIEHFLPIAYPLIVEMHSQLLNPVNFSPTLPLFGDTQSLQPKP